MSASNQPQEFVPPSPEVMEERFLIWKDLMDKCDRFVRAALRNQIGEQGDLELAYANWRIRQCERDSWEKWNGFGKSPLMRNPADVLNSILEADYEYC
jgi:hypothetical protein